jgi:hypothetical protein
VGASNVQMLPEWNRFWYQPTAAHTAVLPKSPDGKPPVTMI